MNPAARGLTWFRSLVAVALEKEHGLERRESERLAQSDPLVDAGWVMTRGRDTGSKLVAADTVAERIAHDLT